MFEINVCIKDKLSKLVFLKNSKITFFTKLFCVLYNSTGFIVGLFCLLCLSYDIRIWRNLLLSTILLIQLCVFKLPHHKEKKKRDNFKMLTPVRNVKSSWEDQVISIKVISMNSHPVYKNIYWDKKKHFKEKNESWYTLTLNFLEFVGFLFVA